jgi:hypothetical protein
MRGWHCFIVPLDGSELWNKAPQGLLNGPWISLLPSPDTLVNWQGSIFRSPTTDLAAVSYANRVLRLGASDFLDHVVAAKNSVIRARVRRIIGESDSGGVGLSLRQSSTGMYHVWFKAGDNHNPERVGVVL